MKKKRAPIRRVEPLRRVEDLHVLLRRFGRGVRGHSGRTDFAKRVGTTLPYLYQVAFGNRKASMELAIRIERESGGLVSAENLVPSADWSYLQQRYSALALPPPASTKRARGRSSATTH